MSESKKRINLTLSDELYNILKEKADLMGTSVQAVILFYCTEYMKQDSVIKSMPGMLQQMSQIQNLMEQK